MSATYLVDTQSRTNWFGISWSLYLICLGASFFVFVEPAPTDFLFVLAFVALMLAGIRPGRIIGPVESIAAVVMLWSVFLSMVFVEREFFIALRAAGIEIYLVLLFLTTAYFVRHGGDYAFRRILTMYVIGGVIASVLGLLAYLHLIPFSEVFFRDRFLNRISSTFKDPNVLGPFLVPGTLFLVWLAIAENRFRVLWLPLILIVLGCLVVTYSRGAYVHTVLSLAVFLGFLLVHEKTRFNTLLAVIAVTIGFLVLLIFFGQEIAERVANSTLGDRLGVQYYDNSRFSDIFASLGHILDKPFGVGPNQSYVVYGYEAHNTFVIFAVNSGLLAGLGLGILYAAAALRCAIKVYRQEDGWLKYGFVLATMAGLFVLMNVVSSLHWRHMWVVMGLAYGTYRSNRILGSLPAGAGR